jgi:hypothetical protein
MMIHGDAAVFFIKRSECVNHHRPGMGDLKFPHIMGLVTTFELSINGISIERMQCSASWSTYFSLVSWGGVRLIVSPLGMSANIWLIVPALDDI